MSTSPAQTDSPIGEDSSSPVASFAIVVPAFNEEATLADTVRSLVAAMQKLHVRFEIIVVNDGSHDQTGKIADSLALEYPQIAALHQQNEGIGGALRTGFAAAEGEFILIWPADMMCEVDDIAPFVDAAGSADVIVGCRTRREGYSRLMRFNSWLYQKLVKRLFGLDLRDVNWICLYRNSLLTRVEITQTGIPMLTELLTGIAGLGGTFREVDVAMKPRPAGVASASRFRVMWRTLVGLLALWWRRRGSSRQTIQNRR